MAQRLAVAVRWLEAGRRRMGRTAVTHTLSRRRRAPRTSSMSAPRVASSRAGTAGAAGNAPGSPARAEGWHRATGGSPLLPSIREHRERCMRLDSLELFKSTNGGRDLASSRRRGPAGLCQPRGSPPLSTRSRGAGGIRRTGSSGARTAAAVGSRPTAVLLSTYFWALAFDPTAVFDGLRGDGAGRPQERRRRRPLATECRGKRCPRSRSTRDDPQTVYAGTDGGLIKSLDGGISWRVVNTAMGSHGRDRATGSCPRSSSTHSTRRRSMRRPVAWVSSGAATAAAAGAPRTPFATRNARTRLSRSPLAHRRPSTRSTAGVASSRASTAAAAGVRRTPVSAWSTVSSLAVDPNRPQTVYASGGQLGLFKSSDGGANWRPVAVGIVDAVALDPRDPRIVLAASATPRVVRSTDAGRTWHAAGAGDRRCCLRRPLLRWSRGPWRSRSAANTPTRQRTRAASTPAATVDAAGANLPPRPRATRKHSRSRRATPLSSTPASSARMHAASTRAPTPDGTWQHLTHGVEDTDVHAVALDPRAPHDHLHRR